MKKLFTLTFMVLCAGVAQAQLQVFSDGRTRTGNLLVMPDATTTQNSVFYGIDDKIHNSNHSYTCGVSSEVYASTQALSFMKNVVGVRGEASDADGMNYGVYGVVVQPTGGGIILNNYTPMNYGAGIYGTTKASMKILSNTYAGYFDGLVGISGSLSVSGNIQGNVLSNAIPSSQTSTVVDREGTSDVANHLSNLRMASFFLDQPKEESIEFSAGTESTEEKEVQHTRIVSPLSKDELQKYSRRHYGLSAEELEEVFPDLVYDNEDGTKSINYVEMVPILVQAINELNAKIEVLEGGDGDVKKVKSQATNTDEMAENVTMLSLAQNKPNPFGTSTTIEVSIPEDVQTAFIYVYDLTGKKLQQVDIPARGKQTVTLNATTLTDGMYLYSLIADGKVVETKRMIVEK